MKEPNDSKTFIQEEPADRFSWITCKPKSTNHDSHFRTCISTDFMLKGDPFVVYEEITLPFEARPEYKGHMYCHIFISKDDIKEVESREKGLYSFPIKIFSDTAATTYWSVSGSTHFMLKEHINGSTKTYFHKEAGIEVCTPLFTVEVGLAEEGPSSRLIISIADMSKFLNSKLWLKGHMRLGQATRTCTKVQTLNQFDIFENRSKANSKRIQAYRLKAPDILRYEHEQLKEDSVKIELTGENKVGVLVWDSMFFDFTQPFLVGLMNRKNKELDVIFSLNCHLFTTSKFLCFIVANST